ncbi:hypothetical protein RYH80_09210 [Halobaculum sp. MBLA0147]|uniref:hypothetical protein n=1 Tax=Halobaculum sp. MBLA0147 TaxID=3079934 RepID=UPI0035248108
MNDQPTRQIDRRDALGLLGASLVPTVGHGSDDGGTVRLPTLASPDGVERWRHVPAAWNEHRLRARRARNRVADRLLGTAGVVDVGLRAGTERYGGRRGFAIDVGVRDDGSSGGKGGGASGAASAVAAELPARVDGVPVETSSRGDYPTALCHRHEYDAVAGGLRVGDGPDGPVGSTGWPVRHGGERRLLSADHVFDDETVYGDESDGDLQRIGRVASRESPTDTAVLETDRTVDNEIRGEYDTYEIAGWVTESGIATRVTDPFDGYRTMGTVTGETTGGLGKYHVDAGYHSELPSFDGHGVRGSAAAAPGDSGGVAFTLVDGDAYLVSLVTHGDPTAGRGTPGDNCADATAYRVSLGTAAYHLDASGYEVLGEPL